MVESLDEFRRQIVACSLLLEEDVRSISDALPEEQRPKDDASLARLLVDQGKLTAFQVETMRVAAGSNLALAENVAESRHDDTFLSEAMDTHSTSPRSPSANSGPPTARWKQRILPWSILGGVVLPLVLMMSWGNRPSSPRHGADLSPLKGAALTNLSANGTRIAELSVLQGMPLIQVHILATRVTDLSPLQGMPLKVLEVSDDLIRAHHDILSVIPTLKTINNKPAAEVLAQQ